MKSTMNMMKTTVLTGILLCAVLTAGCHLSPKENRTEGAQTPVVGNDRDEHGCIGSAGYQWSELLRDCIRPWEKGIKLGQSPDAGSTSATYLVFNADSSKIEVYLPHENEHPILQKVTGENGVCWQNEDTRGLRVVHSASGWRVSEAGDLLYTE